MWHLDVLFCNMSGGLSDISQEMWFFVDQEGAQHCLLQRDFDSSPYRLRKSQSELPSSSSSPWLRCTGLSK